MFGHFPKAYGATTSFDLPMLAVPDSVCRGFRFAAGKRRLSFAAFP